MARPLKMATAGAAPQKTLCESDFERLEAALSSTLPDHARQQIQRLMNDYLSWDFLLRGPDSEPIRKYYRKAEASLRTAEKILTGGPKTDDDTASVHARVIFTDAKKLKEDPSIAATLNQVRVARANFARALKALDAKWSEPAKRGPTPDEGFNSLIATLADCLAEADIAPTLSWWEGAGQYGSPFLSFMVEFVRSLPDEMRSRETTLETHVRAGLKLRKARLATE
jgi:hypothetical protein